MSMTPIIATKEEIMSSKELVATIYARCLECRTPMVGIMPCVVQARRYCETCAEWLDFDEAREE